MKIHASNVAHVFTQETENPIARLVHLALALLADENGTVRTTVHTLEHMTKLLPEAIEIVLGHNRAHEALFPGDVHLVDGIVTVTLAKPDRDCSHAPGE